MNKIMTTISLLIFFSLNANTQIGRLALSPLQKIEQSIAKTKITIEYSRPLKRERKIFDGLVPYGQFWRTGANRNTTIEFSQDVILGNCRVSKGKYAIITKPMMSSWEFLLYNETNNWDVPEELDESKIVCSTSVQSQKLSETIESMTISVGDFTNYVFNLEIKWDDTKVKIPFSLTTKETMATLIKDELEGPTSSDFYSAAVYQLESEKDFKQGLDWINSAIENRQEKVWYDFRVKALLLLQLNDLTEIQNVINEGRILAEKKKSEYGISEFVRIETLIED